MQWGGELGLGGWSKPGFPGVVLVEVRGGAGCSAQPSCEASRLDSWQLCGARAAQQPPQAAVGGGEWGHSPRRLPAWALCAPSQLPLNRFFMLQGAAADVADYVTRLRQLRWQSMAVRAEEDLPMGSQQASCGGCSSWAGPPPPVQAKDIAPAVPPAYVGACCDGIACCQQAPAPARLATLVPCPGLPPCPGCRSWRLPGQPPVGCKSLERRRWAGWRRQHGRLACRPCSAKRLALRPLLAAEPAPGVRSAACMQLATCTLSGRPRGQIGCQPAPMHAAGGPLAACGCKHVPRPRRASRCVWRGAEGCSAGQPVPIRLGAVQLLGAADKRWGASSSAGHDWHHPHGQLLAHGRPGWPRRQP